MKQTTQWIIIGSGSFLVLLLGASVFNKKRDRSYGFYLQKNGKIKKLYKQGQVTSSSGYAGELFNGQYLGNKNQYYIKRKYRNKFDYSREDEKKFKKFQHQLKNPHM